MATDPLIDSMVECWMWVLNVECSLVATDPRSPPNILYQQSDSLVVACADGD